MKTKVTRQELMEAMGNALNRLIREGAFGTNYGESMGQTCGTLEEFDTSAPSGPSQDEANADYYSTIDLGDWFDEHPEFIDKYEDKMDLIADSFTVTSDYDGHITNDGGIEDTLKQFCEPEEVDEIMEWVADYVMHDEDRSTDEYESEYTIWR